MHRFFTDAGNIYDDKITITGDDVNHITKVLRLKQGDTVCVCDKAGTDYTCLIDAIEKDEVATRIISAEPSKTESNINITLYQGVAKGDKMDYIIQKCVELGVKRFVPVITKRTVVKIADGAKKTLRWQKISYEASKQSMRGIIPEICMPINLSDAIDAISAEKNSLSIIAYENEKERTLKSVLKNNNFLDINIIIGPEGGFDETEVVKAERAGILPVTLGARILRTETAPVAVSSAIMYELGGW